MLLLLLAALGAAVYGLWLLLTPHGTALFIVGLADPRRGRDLRELREPFVKPVAIGIFDVVLPALLAIPLVLVSLAPARRRPLVALARPREASLGIPRTRHP